MTLSRVGRIAMALAVSVAMGLGMTSCGVGTTGFMWVLGTQYNQIAGFRIDRYNGNLTGIVGSPIPSGGTSPVMLTLKTGGRYLYVLNAGDATGKTGNVSLFSVGSGGVLTFQYSFPSLGSFPVWLTTDPTGNYLFVLDQHSPAYDGKLDFNGSITVFPLDTNTGRPVGTAPTSYEVGKTPLQMRSTATCLYTLDSGDQTIFPSSLDSKTGKLTSNPTVPLNTVSATSVNIGGSYLYVTDAGATTGGPGSIVGISPGSSCAQLTVNSTVTNLPTASLPVQTVTSANSSGNYVYVLNHSTLNTNYSNSSISAFVAGSDGSLKPLAAAVDNPYSVGSGPVCIAIDPTNQYIYSSDQIASTITGKRIVNQYGFLQQLARGSSFPTVGTPSCLVISPNIGA